MPYHYYGSGRGKPDALKHGKVRRQEDAKTRQAESAQYSCGHTHTVNGWLACPKFSRRLPPDAII